MKKAYFQYYETFENLVQKFTTAEEREAFRSRIINYGLHGEEPQEELSDAMAMGFEIVKELIDDQIHRREINRQNREIKKQQKQQEQKENTEAEKPEEKTETKRFKRPTIEEIENYCNERQNNVNVQQFYNFYESKGWKVGSQAMKDWKAAVRTWEQRTNVPNSPPPLPKLTL